MTKAIEKCSDAELLESAHIALDSIEQLARQSIDNLPSGQHMTATLARLKAIRKIAQRALGQSV